MWRCKLAKFEAEREQEVARLVLEATKNMRDEVMSYIYRYTIFALSSRTLYELRTNPAPSLKGRHRRFGGGVKRMNPEEVTHPKWPGLSEEG